MSDQLEVIHQQMDETRGNLTDKIEMLEQRLMGTVQGTSSAINETVDTVKDVVEETVQSVKDSVRETVDQVKESMDLGRQVQKRPWTMMAGATALGFLGGCLVRGKEKPRNYADAQGNNYGSAPSLTRQGMEKPALAVAAAPSSTNMMTGLGEVLENEIGKLKSLAIGTMFGLVRDMVGQTVPGPLEKRIAEVIDDITTKLGGQPIPGPILPNKPQPASSSERFAEERNRFESEGFPSGFPRATTLN